MKEIEILKLIKDGESCPCYPEFGIRRVIPKRALSRILDKPFINQAFYNKNSG